MNVCSIVWVERNVSFSRSRLDVLSLMWLNYERGVTSVRKISHLCIRILNNSSDCGLFVSFPAHWLWSDKKKLSKNTPLQSSDKINGLVLAFLS